MVILFCFVILFSTSLLDRKNPEVVFGVCSFKHWRSFCTNENTQNINPGDCLREIVLGIVEISHSRIGKRRDNNVPDLERVASASGRIVFASWVSATQPIFQSVLFGTGTIRNLVVFPNGLWIVWTPYERSMNFTVLEHCETHVPLVAEPIAHVYSIHHFERDFDGMQWTSYKERGRKHANNAKMSPQPICSPCFKFRQRHGSFA